MKSMTRSFITLNTMMENEKSKTFDETFGYTFYNEIDCLS